jgi:hypothetical protein
MHFATKFTAFWGKKHVASIFSVENSSYSAVGKPSFFQRTFIYVTDDSTTQN